jgi:translation initiation factor 2 subunit 3
MDIKLSDVIKNQAILNIGATGHVANGKSTLVRAMTGVATQKFKSEKERNITINIGYAGCKIYYSKKLDEFKFCGPDIHDINDSDGNIMELVHHFSFVDCPGHEAFMNNMLTGSAVMDMAFLVEDISSETIPQVQTREHLLALFNSGITDLLVIANKCDLVKKSRLSCNYDKIKDFVEDHYDDEINIIPTIAQKGINIEYIGKFLMDNINDYNKNLNESLAMNVIRTFDVNKPNVKLNKYIGGVVGGSIKSGVVRLGDYIQLNPGIVAKDKNGWVVTPLITKVESLNCDKTSLEYAIPGGLIAIGTTLDPYFCKSDKCIGQLVTHFNDEPLIVENITLSYSRFNRQEKLKIAKGDMVQLGIGSNIINAKIISKEKRDLKLVLEAPVYLNKMRVSIITKIGNKSTIFGIGDIIEYKKVSNINIRYSNIDVPDIKYNLINDLIKLDTDVVDFDMMFNRIDENSIKPKRISLSKPALTVNSSKTQHTFKNYQDMIGKIRHEKDKVDVGGIFNSYLEKMCLCSTSYNSENELIIMIRCKTPILINNIIKVILKIKKCQSCSSLDTYLTKDDRINNINCLTCSSSNSI